MLFSSSADILQNHFLKKKKFRNTIRVPNSLDPDQDKQNVGPDLGPNCFQMLSLDFCLFDLILYVPSTIIQL